MTDPVAIAHDFYRMLWDHRVIIGSIILAAIIAVGLWFLLRNVFIVLLPKKVAVRRAIKRVIQDARDAGSVTRQLWTTGDSARRVPEINWFHVIGAVPTSSAWLVAHRPRKGLFKMFRRHLTIIANHLVEDVHGDKLVVRALSISQHGPVRWPNDDLNDKEMRDKWTPLLLNEEEKASGATPPMSELAGRIHHWYLRTFGLLVVAQQGVEALDDTMLNWTVAMSHNFQQAPARIEELVQPIPNDPSDPARESVPRGP